MPEAVRYVNSIDRILHLRSIRFLADLQSHEVAAIAAHMRPRTFAPGEVLLPPGELVTAAHSIVEGRVSMVKDGKTLVKLGPLDAVGMAAMWAGETEEVEARADVDTVTLEMPREPIIEVLEDQFSILRHVLGSVAGAILDARARLPGAGFGPASELPVQPPARPLDLVERLFVLRRVPVFAAGSIDALVELARHQVEVRVAAGTVLWRGGEPADHSYAILSGAVRCDTANGAFGVGPHQGLGALDAVSGRPRWYRATVEKDLVALRSSMESVLDILEDHPRLAIGMLQTMARDARRLVWSPSVFKGA